MPDAPIRVIVADDHPVVRDGLVAMLETQDDLRVVGEAADGRELVARAAELRPDVVLLDLEMPHLDGVGALREIRAARPDARAVVFTAYDTDERILAALRAGAAGYLLKGAPRDEVFRAIRVAHAGGSLLQPTVAARLLESVRGEGDETPAPAEPLTRREREVLGWLGRGRTNREIARELDISERTVKFHVSAILAKLGAGNRTEAVRLAVEQGLIEL